MDSVSGSADRPHRSTSTSVTATTATSELFICFTSRLSSSSMKISSKSILSPGRAREPSQISLSSSLSRRLRSNGSMKAGQASPMFPTSGKKRGGGFENPEPSSPKVTCIGQVRVKTKKQGKKIRAARSKRRGDVSFRKAEHGNTSTTTNSAALNDGGSTTTTSTANYQDYNMGHFLHSSSHHHQQQECKKWVHLPVTICEALRAFGAEFNCFLPCRSSCMASQRVKEEKAAAGSGEGGNGNGSNSSCGAVFARWLVAVQEDEVKQREIELVVGEGEGDGDEERRESTDMMMRSSQRRHIFEDIEINEFKNENVGEDEEEEARVSICIPPKNALLLMRCRSDPVKMAALANRFWEPPAPEDEDDENGVQEDEEKVEEDAQNVEDEEEKGGGQANILLETEQEISEKSVTCEAPEEEEEHPEAEQRVECVSNGEEVEEEKKEENLSESYSSEEKNQQETADESSPEVFADPEEDIPISALENGDNSEEEDDSGKTLSSELEEYQEEEEEEAKTEIQAIMKEEEEAETEDSRTEEKETETRETSEPGCSETGEAEREIESKEKESQKNLLPDCLLLMMCEPKLSMEVSKETWVCGTDFIRWLPERPPAANKKDASDEREAKRRISVDSNPAPILLQPPRSSCSFPAAPPMMKPSADSRRDGGGGTSMARMIEQKLVGGGKGYEPFVLTRCKSEPMRSAAKLAPDACFWKNRKLEPATLGVGAAGVGF